MKPYQLRWLAFGILALVLLGFGFLYVPAHWTSIWYDLEFTDWCSPIADRLQGGTRLYGPGLHVPLPPLPFVLVRLLHPHGAGWIDESLLNFLFQAGTLLLLYHAFSKLLGAPLAFASAMATVPIFLALSKTMLYDSLTQFLVAACGVGAAALVQPTRDSEPRIRWAKLALEGLLLAMVILTKQSTGAGTAFAVCLALFFLPRSFGFSYRCANVLAVVCFMAVGIALMGIAMTPLVSFSGMIHDVFLIGSEPKGGTAHLLAHFPRYADQLGVYITALYCFGFILAGFFFGRLPIPSFNAPLSLSTAGTASEQNCSSWQAQCIWITLLATVVGFLTMLLCLKVHKPLLQPFFETHWAELLLALGLLPSIYLSAQIIFGRFAASQQNLGAHPLAPYALVFLFSALAHNLSTGVLRLTVDNNPLIFLDVVFIMRSIAFTAGNREATSAKKFPWLQAVLISFTILAMWPLMATNLGAALDCRESWPEIKHLAGARLRTQSEGMRKLVNEVRSFANGTDDTVLLLPDDPNIAAWFERKRPSLSSAIIFTDQYWDRYVDEDFAELQARPPKVIIVGPRNSWRKYSRYWNINRGAERLVDLVKNRLLPSAYDLKLEQPIAFSNGSETDYMDVYVRQDP